MDNEAAQNQNPNAKLRATHMANFIDTRFDQLERLYSTLQLEEKDLRLIRDHKPEKLAEWAQEREQLAKALSRNVDLIKEYMRQKPTARRVRLETQVAAVQ